MLASSMNNAGALSTSLPVVPNAASLSSCLSLQERVSVDAVIALPVRPTKTLSFGLDPFPSVGASGIFENFLQSFLCAVQSFF